MKKCIALLLALVMVLSLTACAKTETGGGAGSSQRPDPYDYDAGNEDKKDEEDSEETTEETQGSTGASYDTIEAKIENEVETTLAALTAEWETLCQGIDSYETYKAKSAQITAFYEKINSTTAALCLKMCAYSIEYAEAVLASGKSRNDMYSDMSDMYDAIYDDACDDIYDALYDDLMDDMYDVLYSGALKDRPDGVEYKDWSGVRSDEYKQWSDTRSEVYEQWSDARSDIYDFWSDVRGEIWDDDIDGAKKEIASFREDIQK